MKKSMGLLAGSAFVLAACDKQISEESGYCLRTGSNDFAIYETGHINEPVYELLSAKYDADVRKLSGKFMASSASSETGRMAINLAVGTCSLYPDDDDFYYVYQLLDDHPEP